MTGIIITKSPKEVGIEVAQLFAHFCERSSSRKVWLNSLLTLTDKKSSRVNLTLPKQPHFLSHFSVTRQIQKQTQEHNKDTHNVLFPMPPPTAPVIDIFEGHLSQEGTK